MPVLRRLSPSQRSRLRAELRLPIFLFKLDLVLLAILAVSRIILALFPLSAPQKAPEIPDWVRVELLDVNEWSRPGTPLDRVNGVVVHYVGNPGTTAAQNRSYFNGLARSHATYASSNFIVDLDGTVLLCVPMDEVAYCSNSRNNDTLSIEVCHPDESGEFTQASYDALVRLVQWLVDAYGLEREDVIRHSDVEGVYKECPRWFVRHPEEWEAFLDRLQFG